MIRTLYISKNESLLFDVESLDKMLLCISGLNNLQYLNLKDNGLSKDQFIQVIEALPSNLPNPNLKDLGFTKETYDANANVEVLAQWFCRQQNLTDLDLSVLRLCHSETKYKILKSCFNITNLTTIKVKEMGFDEEFF